MDCRDKPGNDTEGEWRAMPDTVSIVENRVDDVRVGVWGVHIPRPSFAEKLYRTIR